MLAAEDVLRAVTAPVRTGGCAPRTLVVVAHPDDEVLALGARLARHRESVFLHVTDGAPLDGADAALHGFATLDAYREARAAELHAALALAHISTQQCRTLAIPDQQASFHMAHIAEAVRTAIQELRPAAILTHPYEGGHPDHDACAASVHAAVAATDPSEQPVLVEAAFYHQGPNGIETGCFLGVGAEDTYELDEDERRNKQAMLDAFVTQQDTLGLFPPVVERFRIAPQYDFTRAPHEGLLFYEHYPWGMSGERFRELAGDLLACR